MLLSIAVSKAEHFSEYGSDSLCRVWQSAAHHTDQLNQATELNRVLMLEFMQIPPKEPTMNPLRLSFAIIALLFLTSAGRAAAQVYKWTDASGQVHYSQKKPDDATQAQTLDIAPPLPATPANTDSATEIARINALSEQMARERQAAEQARQEQAIRNLELANQQLQNDLLNQQLQQQQQDKDGDDRVILDNPLPYPYPGPYPRPHPPHPAHPWPCQPWPACRQSPPPALPRPGLLTNPTLRPAPVHTAPAPKSSFRGP